MLHFLYVYVLDISFLVFSFTQNKVEWHGSKSLVIILTLNYSMIFHLNDNKKQKKLTDIINNDKHNKTM